MDHHELQLFLHLSSTLHFGRTSQACNISPSALTRTIQRLEEEVGLPLFERNNRSVRLTEAGERFRDYARETMEGWESFKHEVLEDGATLRGEVSLYCSVTACYSILPDILEEFRSRHPDIHINLETGDAANAVRTVQDGAADLSIAAMPESLPARLSFKAITETPLVFIGPTVPCSLRDQLSGGRPDWSAVPMILSERGLSRRRADSWFRQQGIEPRIYAQVSGNEAILAMTRVGCGVGIVPELVVEKSPYRSDIAVLEIEPSLEPYTVGLCTRTSRLSSPLVSAFWNVVD